MKAIKNREIMNRKLAISLVLIFGNVFSLLSQSTEKIILEFYQLAKHQIKFPCFANIDTIYNKQDTLFIEILDDRIFYLDSNTNRLLITGKYYSLKAKKIRRLLEIPSTKQEYYFIGLQIYDNVYIFKKKKNIYVLSDTRNFRNYPYIYVMESSSLLTDDCHIYNAKSKKTTMLITPSK